MADPTKAWNLVFTKGSKKAQDNLKKVHGKNPQFQAFLKSHGMEGGERSVKQASTSLKKVTDTKVAAQKIADMRFKKALQTSSERVKEMGRRRREGGEGLGGGLETARDVVAHVKKYGSIKAGRLGEGFDPEPADIAAHLVKKHGKGKVTSKHLDAYEGDRDTRRGLDREEIMKHVKKLSEETINEVSKAEAEKVLGGAVKEKPKMGPGKQPAGYRYVRGLARKAMKAGLKKEEVEVTEAVKDAADVGEYDYEGDMAKSQLRSILANAKRLHDMLEDTTNLPEWVQSKITLAEDYILTAANYMEGEMNEEALAALDAEIAEEVELFEKAPPGSKYERMVKHIKAGYAKGGLTKQEKGIAYATAWKAYNKAKNEEVETEETAEQIEEKYMGFKALKASIAAKGGARDPGAVAAAIGRKKYGKEKFQAMAAAGKKANEEVESVDEAKESHVEVIDNAFNRENYKNLIGKKYPKSKAPSYVRVKEVTKGASKKTNEETEVVTEAEAEGKVAVTPKEKVLAAHHGDPKKITYGDVIKARLQSAKEKALKGKE